MGTGSQRGGGERAGGGEERGWTNSPLLLPVLLCLGSRPVSVSQALSVSLRAQARAVGLEGQPWKSASLSPFPSPLFPQGPLSPPLPPSSRPPSLSLPLRSLSALPLSHIPHHFLCCIVSASKVLCLSPFCIPWPSPARGSHRLLPATHMLLPVSTPASHPVSIHVRQVLSRCSPA